VFDVRMIVMSAWRIHQIALKNVGVRGNLLSHHFYFLDDVLC